MRIEGAPKMEFLRHMRRMFHNKFMLKNCQSDNIVQFRANRVIVVGVVEILQLKINWYFLDSIFSVSQRSCRESFIKIEINRQSY